VTKRQRWGVIAVLDALGTSEPKSDEEWESVLDRRLKVIEDAKRFPQAWRQGFFSFDQADAGKEALSFDVTAEMIGFSDTIMFAFGVTPRPKDEAYAIRAVYRYLEEWYVRAVLTGDLYRGALSVGKYFQDGTQILGPAVNELRKAYDEADWAGIVLTKNAGAAMREPAVREHPFAYSRWPVPLHPDCDGSVPTKELWTLCWPTRSEVIDKDMTQPKFWERVEEIFERTKRADVARKRDNTRRYFDEMWKRGLEARAEAAKLAKSIGGD
jgi:hypothetical protein